MRTVFVLVLFTISGLVLCLSCDNPSNGSFDPLTGSQKLTVYESGGYTYKYLTTRGTATILSVLDADTSVCGSYCPNDPVTVRMLFNPYNREDRSRYLQPGFCDSTLVYVMPWWHPSRAWVEEEGLSPGSKRACVRSEVWTNNPLIDYVAIVEFTLQDVDYEKGIDYCGHDTL